VALWLELAATHFLSQTGKTGVIGQQLFQRIEMTISVEIA
jgi:hypothetical protein